MKDEEKEERSKIGIINNFKTTLFYINKSLKKIYRQMVTNIIMSLLFLTAAYIARNILELSDLFSTIFIEGIYIGGWYYFGKLLTILF